MKWLKSSLFFLLFVTFHVKAQTAAPCVEEEESSSGLSLWLSLPFIIFLILMSGLFSGLTLGLLGLDLKQLEIVASGNSTDTDYALAIIPIRQKGNFLLCTLLLGNVAVNAALSILLTALSGGVLAFIISTGLIVIFGEIIPQATCSRHALYIGAKTVYIVRVLMLLLSPVAYPVSLVLDYVLGPEFGNMYSNLELKKLIALHKEDDAVELDEITGKILEGALKFTDQKVDSCMTPWDQVFKLNINSRLNFDLLLTICKTGHSRVPVVETVLGQERVVGLLIVKDLILVDPEDEIPISTVLDLFNHKIVRADPEDSLSYMLHEFQTGLSHIAIVREIDNSNAHADPKPVIRGIITLEDIIEVIIQENIVDEFDNYISMRSQAKTDRKFDERKLDFFNYRQRVRGVMSCIEATAVYHHLVKTLKVFTKSGRTLVPERGFKNLLRSTQIVDIKVEKKSEFDLISDGGLVIYRNGQRADFFVLVLEGKVEIFAGRQKFRSEQARWSHFCEGVLESEYDCYQTRRPALDFVPDFTCRVIKDSRLLLINRDEFRACLDKKYDNLEFSQAEDSRPSLSIDVKIDVKENDKANSEPI